MKLKFEGLEWYKQKDLEYRMGWNRRRHGLTQLKFARLNEVGPRI